MILLDCIYWAAMLFAMWLGWTAMGDWMAGRRIDAASRVLLGGTLDLTRGCVFDLPIPKVAGIIEVAAAIAYLWKHRPPPTRRESHRFRFG